MKLNLRCCGRIRPVIYVILLLRLLPRSNPIPQPFHHSPSHNTASLKAVLRIHPSRGRNRITPREPGLLSRRAREPLQRLEPARCRVCALELS